ncbi:MAG: hypothetical protein HYT16_04605 [DPANN group archaeon]|nr:hypothetical protein [DPANN group archaeon]
MEKGLAIKAIASRASMCVYCGRPASNNCQLCTASVCKEHFNKNMDCCTSCLRGKRI